MINASFGVNLFCEAVDIACGIELNKDELKYKEKNPIYRSVGFDYRIPMNNMILESVDINLSSFRKSEQMVEIITVKPPFVDRVLWSKIHFVDRV